MTNIKTYKDGSRLILVIENCTGETATKVNNFVLDILGMPSEPTMVPEVIPEPIAAEPTPNLQQAKEIKTTDKDKPFNEPIPTQSAKNIAVNGTSGTLGKAIENNDTTAIVELCARSKSMDDTVRYSVLRLCKEYIRGDCLKRDPSCATTFDIRKFFKTYEPLIAGATKQILESAGFARLEDFFDLTDEYVHQDAYRSVLDALIQRVSS